MKRSFTLIEILVTSTIIGILMTIGVTSYMSLSRNSRDARRKADINNLRTALEFYRSDTGGSYPSTAEMSALFTCPPTQALTFNGSTYINPVPNDPKCSSGVVYSYTSDPPYNSYTLTSVLENGSNTYYQANQSGGANVTPTFTPAPTPTSTPVPVPTGGLISPTARPTPTAGICGAMGMSCTSNSQCCSNWCTPINQCF